MKITEAALKFNVTVYVLIIFIIIAGSVAVKSLPLEAAPEVKIPIMIVSTVYPGVAPEDMERLVTNVMERELADLKNVKKLSSSSAESYSSVTIEFEADVDLDMAYQKVRDKVDKGKVDLPADAEDPTIIEINVAEFPMMLVNISGEYKLDKLKQVAETVQDDIEAIPGVLSVGLSGGLDREIQIYLDPAKMEYYKLGVGQVLNRIQQEHRTTPAGSLDLGGNKYSVRIPGEYKNVKLMEDIILKTPGGNPVRLKDVGMVVDGYKERTTISRMDGTECITLRVVKRAGANIVEIAQGIKQLLKDKKDTWPKTTEYSVRQDQSELIETIVADLVNNIISGFILVLLVLLFAMGIRNAFFVAIAIPMSMLISFILIQAMDVTLNMVVLFSLILALGMLVDNSIVVVENIYRHVSEGASRKKAALEATKEVAWPIIASTATTVMMFAPLLFWTGIMGEFMKYIPITVISVLSSSLFVALVINPVVASNFLKPSGEKMFDDSGEAQGFITRRYQAMLRWGLNHPWAAQGIAGAVFVGVIVLFGIFGKGVEFFPNTTPERGQISITAPQGTVLEATDALVTQVEALAMKEKNVKNAVANVGTTGGMVQVGAATNQAVIDLEFKDPEDCIGDSWDTIHSLRDKLKKLGGAEYRVDVEEMGPPTGAPVSVEISGDDYAKLNEYAVQVKEYLNGVNGVVDIKDDYEAGKPEIQVTVDREKAMLRKVNTQSVSTAIRAAINGIEASVLREGEDEFDIIVRYDEDARRSINDILDIRVTGEDDVQIPVRDVATVQTAGGFGSINHIDRKRTIAVTADVSLASGKSSAEVMAQVEKEVPQKIKLPSGYSFNFSGESEEEKKSADFLVRAFMIGFMLMALILITQFNSVMRPGIILGSVVMSMVGVLVGLVLTQSKFSVMMTGMGIISLAGVVVNNAIVLIDYTDQLKKQGLPLKEALLRAGVVRFRPVMLTAITTILGLLPMAMGVGIDFTTLFETGRIHIDTAASSSEFWGPMAQAVCFGLLFATLLTLVLVPAMYQAQGELTNSLMRFIGIKKNGDNKIATQRALQKKKDSVPPPAATDQQDAPTDKKKKQKKQTDTADKAATKEQEEA
ncbi:MAG: efflux RND transporter permease subunit [Deltaproteobacteria bacterium]|nr:efflux RND transporter permease subunit [Deltaproteobacteria bacterium]MBN2670925.1 efflux RND transporter permease subunit [Deltaproteobacteria bacterium]